MRKRQEIQELLRKELTIQGFVIYILHGIRESPATRRGKPYELLDSIFVGIQQPILFQEINSACKVVFHCGVECIPHIAIVIRKLAGLLAIEQH